MNGNNTIKTKPSPAKAQITECHLFVPLSKSKKLSQLRANNSPAPPPQKTAPKTLGDQGKFKPGTLNELVLAKKLIDDKINQLLKSYPENKKNRLFIIRFGTTDSIKAMPLAQAFNVLEINQNTVNMRLIADLDYNGNRMNGHT